MNFRAKKWHYVIFTIFLNIWLFAPKIKLWNFRLLFWKKIENRLFLITNVIQIMDKNCGFVSVCICEFCWKWNARHFFDQFSIIFLDWHVSAFTLPRGEVWSHDPKILENLPQVPKMIHQAPLTQNCSSSNLVLIMME